MVHDGKLLALMEVIKHLVQMCTWLLHEVKLQFLASTGWLRCVSRFLQGQPYMCSGQTVLYHSSLQQPMVSGVFGWLRTNVSLFPSIEMYHCKFYTMFQEPNHQWSMYMHLNFCNFKLLNSNDPSTNSFVLDATSREWSQCTIPRSSTTCFNRRYRIPVTWADSAGVTEVIMCYTCPCSTATLCIIQSAVCSRHFSCRCVQPVVAWQAKKTFLEQVIDLTTAAGRAVSH